MGLYNTGSLAAPDRRSTFIWSGDVRRPAAGRSTRQAGLAPRSPRASSSPRSPGQRGSFRPALRYALAFYSDPVQKMVAEQRGTMPIVRKWIESPEYLSRAPPQPGAQRQDARRPAAHLGRHRLLPPPVPHLADGPAGGDGQGVQRRETTPPQPPAWWTRRDTYRTRATAVVPGRGRRRASFGYPWVQPKPDVLVAYYFNRADDPLQAGCATARPRCSRREPRDARGSAPTPSPALARPASWCSSRRRASSSSSRQRRGSGCAPWPR